jgi:hypothetical protein
MSGGAGFHADQARPQPREKRKNSPTERLSIVLRCSGSRAVVRPRSGYWIVCSKATAVLPKIEIFRDWLLRETADDTRRQKALA